MTETSQAQEGKKGLGAGVIILITIATTVLTVWLFMAWMFPKSFSPVELSKSEQVTLDKKMKALNLDLAAIPSGKRGKTTKVLEPQPYTEEGAKREVSFTEREINALIASNTDLADKVAVDLSPGLVSARALIPLDPDMPLVGGKTLKISAGVVLNFRDGKPVVMLKGVSLWGVPVPNDWLGNLKNVDLVAQYGEAGFWKSFAAGVDSLAVGDGKLTVRLKE